MQIRVQCGLISAGICYSGCNTLWVACVAGAGGVAGVSTGGIGVAPAILACNSAQGICMAACIIALATPTP
eukprot:403363828